jgi:predicted nucleic acid-binding protein
MIGAIDTLIAATALEHQRTIVTLDGDFQCILNLSVMQFAREDLQ